MLNGCQRFQVYLSSPECVRMSIFICTNDWQMCKQVNSFQSFSALTLLWFCHTITYETKLLQQREQNIGSGARSAHLFDIQTFWVAPGSSRVGKKNTRKSVFWFFFRLHTHALSLLLLKKCNTDSHNIKSNPKEMSMAMSILMRTYPFLIFFSALSFASVVLIIWHLSFHVAQLVSLLL